MHKIFFILIILLGVNLMRASNAHNWDVHQTLERGRVELVDGSSPNMTEAQWNSDNTLSGDYTLPTSMKTIYFVDSTFIDFSYVLISKASGISYFVIEDSIFTKLDSQIEENDLVNHPNVFIDFTTYCQEIIPTRLMLSLFTIIDGKTDVCRIKNVESDFVNFDKYIFDTKPYFYYVCLVSGYALRWSIDNVHVDFKIPRESYIKPQYINDNIYYRAIIAR